MLSCCRAREIGSRDLAGLNGVMLKIRYWQETFGCLFRYSKHTEYRDPNEQRDTRTIWGKLFSVCLNMAGLQTIFLSHQIVYAMVAFF